MSGDVGIRKIVYFDKETINNLLQQSQGGALQKTKSSSVTKSLDTEVSGEVGIKLAVPFLSRLKFLFTGNIAASYVRESNTMMTISSTDISEFEEIKEELESFKNRTLKGVKNSLTSLRTAAGFYGVMQENQDGLKPKEVANLLNDLEGYDIYEIGEKQYARFNSMAFLSNCKRNDILLSRLDLYCVKVGDFISSDFDFLKQLQDMQSLFNSDAISSQTLYDLYPSDGHKSSKEPECRGQSSTDRIELYDVVCAYISGAEK